MTDLEKQVIVESNNITDAERAQVLEKFKNLKFNPIHSTEFQFNDIVDELYYKILGLDDNQWLRLYEKLKGLMIMP